MLFYVLNYLFYYVHIMYNKYYIICGFYMLYNI